MGRSKIRTDVLWSIGIYSLLALPFGIVTVVIACYLALLFTFGTFSPALSQLTNDAKMLFEANYLALYLLILFIPKSIITMSKIEQVRHESAFYFLLPVMVWLIPLNLFSFVSIGWLMVAIAAYAEMIISLQRRRNRR